MIKFLLEKNDKQKKVIGNNEHGFMKRKSCLTSQIVFHSETTGLVDEVRAVDIVCLDFSKPFHTVSRNINIDKTTK